MSKPNLPPLPADVDMVRVLFRGQPEYFEPQNSYYTSNQMRAYAEEAVRQALAAQQAVAWLYHDGKPGVVPDPRDMCTSVLLTLSRQPWCRNEMPLALIPETSPGHKPAPVDTSSGHSTPETRDG